MDVSQARAELWRRYDDGEATADEVEVRLQLLDRIGDGDEDRVRAALDARVPVRRRRSVRRAVLMGLGVLVLGGGIAGVIVVAAALSDGDSTTGSDDVQPGGGPTRATIVVEPPVPVPQTIVIEGR